MKRTIVVADRDEKLQQGFMSIFSEEHYEILYAPNGRAVEKIAARLSPDIYLVNVNLPKMNGIEVQEKLQKQGYLDNASFFFLKDEADTTELSEYQADGVIEKPINFFSVYETITSEDAVIELTDLVEEEEETLQPQVKEQQTETTAPGPRPAHAAEESAEVETKAAISEEIESQTIEDDVIELTDLVEEEEETLQPQVKEQQTETTAPGPRPAVAAEESAPTVEETKAAVSEEIEPQTMIGRRLRQAMHDTVRDNAVCFPEMKGAVDAGAPQSELEQQFKAVLNQAMSEAAHKLSSQLAPILTRYVEDYVTQMLLETTEKVIREEIDKLLKESVE